VPLDLDTFLALPRLSGLMLTPQGDLLVHESTLDPAGTDTVTAIWQIGPGGPGDPGARRLTLPRPGAALAGVLPDGSLLLRDKREDPEAAKEARDAPDADAPALWLLPAGGGEARQLLRAPAGVGAVTVARAAGTVTVITEVFPGETTLEDDRAKARRRKDTGTSALWFDRYPVRYWDHHLAPRAPRLLVLDPATGSTRDLTGDVGQALAQAAPALTPDGARVLTTWVVDEGGTRRRRDLVAIDTETGLRTTLGSVPGEHGDPAVSPDGRWAAATRLPRTSPGRPASEELWLFPLAGQEAEPRRLAAGLDRWPTTPVFTADSTAVLFTADDGGRCSVFRVAFDEGATAVRLSRDGAFSDVVAAADGGAVYALRSRVAAPPEVVALDPLAGDQEGLRVLHGRAPAEPWPGLAEEVHATAADGTPLRAWLVLPPRSPAPAPLAVLIHGGPLSSWNAWSWRWQPQLLAARGYAVLLPDPALSTGYGQAHIDRGWQEWGGTPYTDVLALTDATIARADVDGARTAVLGGSYGGYLTNWVIGHTDRFRCAVTHASLWELTGFQGTTDDATAWADWFGDPVQREDFYRLWSPRSSAAAVVTPTLVIHGEQDHRVPVGEGLRLFTDLQERGVESALLYFPDENHWIRKPGNVRVWYDAVLRWLDHHLGAGGAVRPELA